MKPVTTDNFLPRIKRLLLPHIGSVQERQDLLAEAFFISERWVRPFIIVDGSANGFATHCIDELYKRGRGRSGRLLAILLETLYYRVGVNDQQEIEALKAFLPQLPEPDHLPEEIGETAATIQTIHTPQPERTPTIFISYTRHDKQFASQLLQQLTAHGYACWENVVDLQGTGRWNASVSEGMSNSYAFISVVGEQASHSTWAMTEYLWANRKQKPIVIVQPQPAALPDHLTNRPLICFDDGQGNPLGRLLAQLPPPMGEASRPVTPPSSESTLRERALTYMDELWLDELQHVSKYTPLSGQAHLRQQENGWLDFQPIVASQAFRHLPKAETQWHQESRTFEDAVSELQAIRRAVLLGEPGAGKTTTLFKLAAELIATAKQDPTAPIPIMIRLGA